MIHNHPLPAEQPFHIAFDALSDRDALRLFRQLAYRFSYSVGHDKILAGIAIVAADAAEEAGMHGDDLAARWLDNPLRFGPDYQLAPVVQISPTSVIA